MLSLTESVGTLKEDDDDERRRWRWCYYNGGGRSNDDDVEVLVSRVLQRLQLILGHISAHMYNIICEV